MITLSQKEWAAVLLIVFLIGAFLGAVITSAVMSISALVYFGIH